MHNSPELSGGTISSEEQPINPYGVGIDCHSKFIAVCVFVQAESLVRHERQFKTTWPELTMAREWVLSILSPLGLESTSFHFTIESTGCYHYPVIISLAGTPHVVNPSLASPTRRKTDTLDAKLLAYHALTGLWPESYFPGPDVQTLRVLLLRRRQCAREKNRALSGVNNVLLRFGVTIAA